MTRVTNLGRKRSFVEASFNYNEDQLPDEPTPQPALEPGTPTGEEEKPPKKKRKRGKRPKSGDKAAVGDSNANGDGTEAPEAGPSVSKKPRKLNSFKGTIYSIRL